ncbi:MAG TPA: extracellular solute-binding protein [Bauldia sp.]|nr:extracellular solute-binding protein [Bauldia sp.]
MKHLLPLALAATLAAQGAGAVQIEVAYAYSSVFDPTFERIMQAFATAHPDIEVTWTRRSLRDFGVQPVEVLAEQFDLIVIDHPFCGRAKTTGCLRDLRPLFPAAFFAMLEEQSVGPSTRSYDFGGVWALPTDAASQVASYRPDLLGELGFDGPPRRFDEVIAVGEAARKAGKWLALPSCQSDAACLVASLAANPGGHRLAPAAGCVPNRARPSRRADRALASRLDELEPDQYLRRHVHRRRHRLRALWLRLHQLLASRGGEADPLYDHRRARS